MRSRYSSKAQVLLWLKIGQSCIILAADNLFLEQRLSTRITKLDYTDQAKCTTKKYINNVYSDSMLQVVGNRYAVVYICGCNRRYTMCGRVICPLINRTCAHYNIYYTFFCILVLTLQPISSNDGSTENRLNALNSSAVKFKKYNIYIYNNVIYIIYYYIIYYCILYIST